jgi:hypothetical protein
MESSSYGKALILALVILGLFVLLIPSVLSEPNFQGVPTISPALFALALAVYLFIKDYRKMFYGTIIVLLLIFGYTGFWAYNYKMPLSCLEVSMEIRQFNIGPSFSVPPYPGNGSFIWFSLNVLNPTNVDTPPFNLENPAIYINNVKLENGFSIHFGRTFSIDSRGYGYCDPLMVIKAHETLTIQDRYIAIYQQRLQVDEDTPQNVWAYMVSRSFTLGMSGSFVSRPNFQLGDTSGQSLWVLAQSAFKVSQKIGES